MLCLWGYILYQESLWTILSFSPCVASTALEPYLSVNKWTTLLMHCYCKLNKPIKIFIQRMAKQSNCICKLCFSSSTSMRAWYVSKVPNQWPYKWGRLMSEQSALVNISGYISWSKGVKFRWLGKRKGKYQALTVAICCNGKALELEAGCVNDTFLYLSGAIHLIAGAL